MDAKKILFNMMYVPIMKRWGDDQHGHHYLLGVFDSLEKAINVAKEERKHRGGKYEWVIEAYSLNKGRDSIKETKMFRVARSEEMNCLIDSEKEKVFNDEELSKKLLNKVECARLKSDIENLEKIINEKKERVESYERQSIQKND